MNLNVYVVTFMSSIKSIMSIISRLFNMDSVVRGMSMSRFVSTAVSCYRFTFWVLAVVSC